MQSNHFIKNKKKIVITGAAGFVGKSVVKKLLKHNYFVISVDVKDPKIKSKNHRYFETNIKDFFLNKKIGKIFAIIHLAADPRNNLYYLKPELALENISNTFIILNYINSLKEKPILIFSSTKQIELDALSNNLGPYSISKKSSEELINFYYRNFSINSYIIRFTEVFSIKDNPKNKALRKFIKKCAKNENITIDNKKHIFEFINIDIICDGIIKILDNKIKSRHINFYGNKINILELLKKIKKIIKSKSKVIIKQNLNRKSYSKSKKNFNYKLKKKELFISNLDRLVENELK